MHCSVSEEKASILTSVNLVGTVYLRNLTSRNCEKEMSAHHKDPANQEADCESQ